MPTPPSISHLCRHALPLMLAATDGPRALRTARQIVATDRWNSFDRFHETTATIVRHYERAGARAEVEPVQTGGRLGTGRWIINEASDVRGATLDVIAPLRRRVADYRRNPWHAVQWTAATPVGGVTAELVAIDDPDRLRAMPAGALAGKALLTHTNIRAIVGRLADLAPAAVIVDRLVPGLPDAVMWNKLGWGGVPMTEGPARLVALTLSANQGASLRRLLEKPGAVRVHVEVDARAYVGTHDVVSGVIEGREIPSEEVWAIAHSAEPGAIDNASGVITCIEIARVLGRLIAEGSLPRPRRSIRLVNGYECFSFFPYLENVPRPQPPLAGVNIDTVGTRPESCAGKLNWHATIPMSATFVDRVGEAILRAALRRKNPGYRLLTQPFLSTADTLIGDPQYGFPCPWLSSHYGAGTYYQAYHSSADVMSLLSGDGLAVGAAAMAAYLYYLADAGGAQVCELAATEAAYFEPAIRNAGSPAKAHYLREQHAASLERLRLWVGEEDRAAVLAILAESQSRVARAGRRASTRAAHGSGARVPRRLVPITARLDNVAQPLAGRIARAGLADWALYWADGRRTLAEIAVAITLERGKMVTLAQVIEFFEGHAELGYVEWA